MRISKRKLDSKDKKIGDFYVLAQKINSTFSDKKNFIYIEGRLLIDEIKLVEKLFKSNKSPMDKIRELKNINTKFCGVLFENGKIYVFQDKYANYMQMYYSFKDSDFIISNQFNDTVKYFKYGLKDVNHNALKEHLLLEFPIGRKTFMENVSTLLTGETLIYDLKKSVTEILFENSYHVEKKFDGTIEEAQVKFDELLDKALKNIKARYPAENYGLGLSGGFDSRIVAFYALKNKMKLNTYIFGEPESDAFYVAQRIAKKFGVPLKKIEPDYNFLAKHYKEQLESNPIMDFLFLWYYSVYDRLPEFDVLLNGFNGDNTMGSHVTDADYVPRETTIDNIKKKYINPFSVPLLNKFDIDEAIRDDIDHYSNYESYEIRENFSFRNRQHKLIKEIPSMNFLYKYPGVSPFEDNDVIEFSISLPIEWRKNKKFYLDFINWRMPEESKIRAEREPYPISDKNPIVRNVKTIVYLFDYHLKLHILWKKQHKDVYKWTRNNEPFWDFVDQTIARHGHKFDYNEKELKKLMDKYRKGKIFFRGGRKTQPLFLFMSVLLFLSQFEDE